MSTAQKFYTSVRDPDCRNMTRLEALSDKSKETSESDSPLLPSSLLFLGRKQCLVNIFSELDGNVEYFLCQH